MTLRARNIKCKAKEEIIKINQCNIKAINRELYEVNLNYTILKYINSGWVWLIKIYGCAKCTLNFIYLIDFSTTWIFWEKWATSIKCQFSTLTWNFVIYWKLKTYNSILKILLHFCLVCGRNKDLTFMLAHTRQVKHPNLKMFAKNNLILDWRALWDNKIFRIFSILGSIRISQNDWKFQVKKNILYNLFSSCNTSVCRIVGMLSDGQNNSYTEVKIFLDVQN